MRYAALSRGIQTALSTHRVHIELINHIKSPACIQYTPWWFMASLTITSVTERTDQSTVHRAVTENNTTKRILMYKATKERVTSSTTLKKEEE